MQCKRNIMRKTTALILAMGIGALSPAQASDASGLGMLIGAAEACGLHLDDSRVAAVVAEAMPQADLQFPSILSAWSQIGREQVERASSAERAALCEAARVNATGLSLMAP
jgi:hypothetical protein